MMPRTLATLRTIVKDNLELEGVTPPSSERITHKLNDAKNIVCGLIDNLDQNAVVTRKDYTVTTGDASITLPDGSGADPAVRRIVGLDRVDSSGAETPVPIIDSRRKYGYETPDDWRTWFFENVAGSDLSLYREGNALYFNNPTGSPGNYTLRLRYAAVVADLSGHDLDASYSLIEDEWLDLVTLKATLMLLPATQTAAATKYLLLWNERLQQLAVGGTRFNRTNGLHIRAVW